MKAWIVLAGLLAGALLAVPSADLYYKSSWGGGCARCHEIAFNYDVWRHSAHRSINCVDCHASSVLTNLRRVAKHVTGEVPAQVHLGAQDVDAMLPKCRGCHRQEFAQWSAGAHSMTYARMLKDPKKPLIDDCMRCHGMYYDGGIRQLAQDATAAGRPAIPCLACHAMHRQGEPLDKPGKDAVRPSVALYDRRTRVAVPVALLTMPSIFDGDRQVKTSRDQRQALCYQCHAPLSTMQARSGDDRTPLGVHEGLSCLACHQKHGQSARQSCAECHPRLSNCGRDVENMDTTFRDLKSRNNVHTVKCVDCHPKGAPRKRPS